MCQNYSNETFYIPVIFFYFSDMHFAQVKISGKLTDNKNKPFRGASITIKNSYDGATTDSLGNYSFTTTENGSKILEVSLTGYTAYSKNIKIG